MPVAALGAPASTQRAGGGARGGQPGRRAQQRSGLPSAQPGSRRAGARGGTSPASSRFPCPQPRRARREAEIQQKTTSEPALPLRALRAAGRRRGPSAARHGGSPLLPSRRRGAGPGRGLAPQTPKLSPPSLPRCPSGATAADPSAGPARRRGRPGAAPSPPVLCRAGGLSPWWPWRCRCGLGCRSALPAAARGCSLAASGPPAAAGPRRRLHLTSPGRRRRLGAAGRLSSRPGAGRAAAGVAAKPCPLPAAPALLRGTRGQWRDRFAPPFAERAGGEGELQGGSRPGQTPRASGSPVPRACSAFTFRLGFACNSFSWCRAAPGLWSAPRCRRRGQHCSGRQRPLKSLQNSFVICLESLSLGFLCTKILNSKERNFHSAGLTLQLSPRQNISLVALVLPGLGAWQQGYGPENPARVCAIAVTLPISHKQ